MKFFFKIIPFVNILYMYLALTKEPIIGYFKKRLARLNIKDVPDNQLKEYKLLNKAIKNNISIDIIKYKSYLIHFKIYDNSIINKSILIIKYINNYIDTDIKLFNFFKKTNKVDMIIDIVEKNKQINNSNIHYLEYNIKNINKKIISKKDIIIISAFVYNAKRPVNEIYNLPRIIYQSIIGLNHLKKRRRYVFF